MKDSGKYPMKELHTMIRQWYVLAKHDKMLPETVDTMLTWAFTRLEAGTSRAR